MNKKFWHGKRVFLTGHTGFKGGWLSIWLSRMGAIVSGYSLDAPTTPNIFSEARIKECISQHTTGDVRNIPNLLVAIRNANPDIVFHLAAQSLVRYSYVEPVETYEINVMGTVNLLEACRKFPNIGAVVNVTSDKCYANTEQDHAYSEHEILGGYDPYSSSKACSELITSAYRNSFLSTGSTFLASARAGNVIGGGDWAVDRLIPDFFRAVDQNKILEIRSPNAIRPWQHVLEPLAGYLILAEKLYKEGGMYADAWNFGPEEVDTKSVEWVVQYLSEKVPNSKWVILNNKFQSHEAKLLKLNNCKAKNHLGWMPRWNIETALDKTIEWHKEYKNNSNMLDQTLNQISQYEDFNS